MTTTSAPNLPQQRSQQLLNSLLATVTRDYSRGQASIIRFFINGHMRGGWEAWLQVEFAQYSVASMRLSDFAREVQFPGTTMRCDLWFQDPIGGVPIWVELKTQRNHDYRDIVSDFVDDIEKLLNLSSEFRRNNILMAAAVFELDAGDVAPLDQLRTSGRPGALHYMRYQANAPWLDVTQNLAQVPLGSLLCTSYRLN
jgi:hypothetical protein